MHDAGNDRDRCLEKLSSESPNYLFGNSQNGPGHDMLSGFGEMTINNCRPRSDSSSSSMSNTSSGSVSSRPPYSTSHSLMNVPGYRGPINLPADDQPLTAPVRPNDIVQFLDLVSGDRSAQYIPSINCNNNVNSNSNRTKPMSFGVSYGHNSSGTSSQNLPGHSQPGLRPIEVQHVKTSDHSSSPVPQRYTYQIQIDPRLDPGSGASQVFQPNAMSGGWTHHPIQAFKTSSYQNMTNNPNVAYDLQPLPTSQQQQYNYYPSGMSTPDQEQRSFGAMNYGSQSPYGGQHSTQATIYLHNPVGNVSHYNTTPRIDRTIHSHSPMGGASNFNVHSSASDSRLSPNFMRSTSQSHQPSTPQHRNVVVEIKQRDPSGLGVQSQIQYFNNIAGGQSNSSGGGQHSAAQMSSVIGHASPALGADSSGSAQYERTSTRPTVINLQGPGASQEEGGYLKFPPMPNLCRVPGHGHGPVSSVDMGFKYGECRSELDMRPTPMMPYVSPASSHSSLSSESSAVREPERPRSGSLADDPEYTQALLSHQKSRLEKLIDDLSSAEDRVKLIKNEVTTLEQRVIEKKSKKSTIFPSSADLAKLRGDNLQLQADIRIMTNEIDLYNFGQTPLGVLDPLEQQNFYKTMNTGQRGSIYGKAAGRTPQTFTSTMTTAVTTTVSLPTRPAPEIPPTLPPRDTPSRDVPPPLPPRITTNHAPQPPPPQPMVNSGDSDIDGDQWNCSACTFLNHPALNKCECCEMPRMNVTSSVMAVSSPSGDIPDTYPSPLQSAQST